MKILILGSGAREHALAWKFSKSRSISGLFCAPGNAGTGEVGENLSDTDPTDADAVIAACRENQIDIVFSGSEAPLAAGVVDRLEEAGIKSIGPKQKSAALEYSKSFSKAFMVRNGVPTAEAKEFHNLADFKTYLNQVDHRVVLKKSGLAAGKGVLESEDTAEMLQFAEKVLQDDVLIAEEFLTGYEISVFAITDGNSYKLLPVCADFKKAGEGDTGLNTGGMGAICPVPTVTAAIIQEVEKKVIQPTFRGLEKEGLQFTGILYFGLMMTKTGPKVLEYNIRFGDPEAQVLIPLIKSDIGDLSDALVNGNLDQFPLELHDGFALCVVVAAEGYPEDYEKHLEVAPFQNCSHDGKVRVFQASTYRDGETLKTNGGRCFTVVGRGSSMLNARARAYEGVKEIQFKGAWYRRDIGERFLTEEK